MGKVIVPVVFPPPTQACSRKGERGRVGVMESWNEVQVTGHGHPFSSWPAPSQYANCCKNKGQGDNLNKYLMATGFFILMSLSLLQIGCLMVVTSGTGGAGKPLHQILK